MPEEQNRESELRSRLSKEKTLARCPFCGGMPRIDVLELHHKGKEVEAERARMYCRVCGASTKVWKRDQADEIIDNDALKTAIAAWSMRNK